MGIWLKIHKTPDGEVLAACDEELLGKTLETEKLCLHISENFFKGKLVDEKEFEENLEGKRNLNIVGMKAVEIAKNNDLVKEIIYINGVPYTMIVVL